MMPTNVGEMQSLGNHLRADEDVDLANPKRAENFAVERFLRHHVGIHPLDARLGKRLLDGGLDLFRAHASVADGRILALGTLLGYAAHEPAQVTEQLLGFAVIRERDAAVGALGNVAALRAEQMRRIAAAVEKQDDLLTLVEPGLDRVP